MFARSTAWRHGVGRHLEAGHVDQLQVAPLHQQVRGLDVAVGDADVPELPDQLQPLVDDRVVDLGIAEVLRVLEELRSRACTPGWA